MQDKRLFTAPRTKCTEDKKTQKAQRKADVKSKSRKETLTTEIHGKSLKLNAKDITHTKTQRTQRKTKI